MAQTIAIINLLDSRQDETADVVRLSTIHAAKGLEFGHVFLIGVEEEILPHREAVEAGMLEEERRLMYVAITRAQRSLTLSYCRRRKRGGDWQSCEASRFVGEIDRAVLQRMDEAPVAGQSRELGAQRLAQLKNMLK